MNIFPGFAMTEEQNKLAEEEPEAMKWFRKGRESVLRKNQSGCCCLFNEEDEIVSVCAAHKEWAAEREPATEAVRADNLNYEGGGRIKVAVEKIVNSQRVQRQVEAVKKIEEQVGGCGVCSGPPLKFGTGCTLPNCPYSGSNLAALLRESLPYVAIKLSTADLVERIEIALKGKGASQGVAQIRPTHKAADAFWAYWKANGETHKHGYYESTWGAINAALKAAAAPDEQKG